MSYKVPKAPRYVPCPHCGNEDVKEDGGLIAVFVARHSCERCGCVYRSRTGRRAKIDQTIDGLIEFVIDLRYLFS
jgi:hypothetical protein